MRAHALLLSLACVLLGSPASAEPAAYRWGPPEGADTLLARFPAPDGFTRVPAEGFGAWLRELPLAPPTAKVLYFDGRDKPRQDVHAAVIAVDVGTRDLQQCADAVMRMRAEWLFSQRRLVEFHPDPGKPRALRYDPTVSDPSRKRFAKYLVAVFADAGSASLQAEMARVNGPVQPGDVLIQGGYPGHAVLVLDVAADKAGKRRLLLAQSYMPAQSFHVLRADAAHPEAGAWYDEAALDRPAGLQTPEWRPFKRADVRRFR